MMDANTVINALQRHITQIEGHLADRRFPCFNASSEPNELNKFFFLIFLINVVSYKSGGFH